MFSLRSWLKPMQLVSGLAAICLMFLCSCATKNSNHRQFLFDVPMNKDAGRGGFLEVTLQLKDGEKLPFILDTGSSGRIVVDESMVSKLGNSIGTATIRHWGKREEKHVYAAPQLYLGGVLLMAGDSVMADDFKDASAAVGHRIMGMIGIDMLQHYCIQLDFAAGKIRFLDDQTVDTKTWGQSFPIVALNAQDPRPSIAQNLLGVQGPHSLIDSGYIRDGADGWLMPKFYEQWTNQTGLPTKDEAHSPEGMFGGEKYSEVSLNAEDVESDGIGLCFLARHLVTLDFPKKTLYLKRMSDFPLIDKNKENYMHQTMASVMKYLIQLNHQNLLPGSSKDDHGTAKYFHFNHTDLPYLDLVTVDGQKQGDADFCHYTCIRTSKNGSWKLQKAWRTDGDDKVLEEYPVP